MDRHEFNDLVESREAEKDLVIELNKRLEKVNRRNRELQQDIIRLNVQLRDQPAANTAAVAESAANALKQLNGACAEVRDTKMELHRLKTQLEDARRESLELRRQLESANTEMDAHAEEIADLVRLFDRIKADLRKETEGNKRLQRENEKLKDDGKRDGDEISELKKLLEKERLLRYAVEQQLCEKSKVEIHTRHVVNERPLAMPTNTNFDAENERRQKRFEDKMEENYRILRENYIIQLAKHKEEQERLFSAKEKDHIAKNKSITKEIKEKNARLNEGETKIKKLNQKIRKLESDRTELIERVDEMERESEEEIEHLKAQLANKDRLLEEKIREKRETLTQYQALLDIRTPLRIELNTYWTLVTDEETRHATLE